MFRKNQSDSISSSVKYKVLLDLSKEDLKRLIALKYIKKETKFSYLDNLSTQLQIGKDPELVKFFQMEDIFNHFDEWSKRFFKSVFEDLLNSFDFLQDSKLEIPETLPQALDDYLENSENEVYLATGRSGDGKPSFLIIIKSDNSKLKVVSDHPIDTSKWNEHDFQEWPNIEDSNAHLWKASKN